LRRGPGPFCIPRGKKKRHELKTQKFRKRREKGVLCPLCRKRKKKRGRTFFRPGEKKGEPLPSRMSAAFEGKKKAVRKKKKKPLRERTWISRRRWEFAASCIGGKKERTVSRYRSGAREERSAKMSMSVKGGKKAPAPLLHHNPRRRKKDAWWMEPDAHPEKKTLN